MECLPDNDLLKFHPNTLVEVRKMYGYEKPEDMDKAIDILDDWVKEQNHFVKKDFSRAYFERCILNNKGSIEKSKRRLDSLCTMKTLLPHFYGPFDFEKELNIPKMWQMALPKLTEDHGRVCLVKCDRDSFTPSLLFNYYRSCILVCEYLISHDFHGSISLIIDSREANSAELLKNIKVIDLHEVVTIILKGYGARVKNIHLLTSSKLIDAFIAMLKPVLSPKLRERIKVHKTVESLHEFVPKDVLPIEYGGQEKSVYKMYEEWVKTLSSEEVKELWSEMCRARTDESCRQTNKFNDLYMGTPGTFRSLSVD